MAKRTDLYHLPINNLRIVEGFNARIDYGDIEGLANSIAENGVKVPLRIYKEKGSDVYAVVDGHRRFKAVEYAVEHNLINPDEFLIPCIMESKGSNEADRVIGMIIYNDGKRLTMLEEAEVYKRLIGYGFDEISIAKKVGKTRTHIDNCLLLMSASPELKQKVIDGDVSASFIIEELRNSNSDDVLKDIEEAKEVTGVKKISKKHLTETKKNKMKKPFKKDEDGNLKFGKTADGFLRQEGILSLHSIKLVIRYGEEDEEGNKKEFDLVKLLDKYLKFKTE